MGCREDVEAAAGWTTSRDPPERLAGNGGVPRDRRPKTEDTKDLRPEGRPETGDPL